MSLWNRHRADTLYPRGFKSLRRQKRGKNAGKQFAVFAGRRLQMERLEDRYVLSVATVNTALDVVDLSDNVTSLREALFFTNALIGHDTIEFDASLAGQTIQLTLGELSIKDSLTINGLGQSMLTIDASGNDPTSSTDNGDGSRIFNIDDGNGLNLLDVSINGLTLLGGDITGIGSGGAILNSEALVLSDSTIKENSAFQGGGIFNAAVGSTTVVRSTIASNRAANGAGIYSVGVSMNIDSSTISGNVAVGQGGALYSRSQALNVTNSTLSGNTANVGGAIYTKAQTDGTTQIRHSTITSNRALSAGGINFGSTTNIPQLDHTIVAANTRLTTQPDDIVGAVAARFSIIGTNFTATITNNGGNQIGTQVAPINPLLGPLADNGGPTLTHALLLSSPAIDAGDPAFVVGVSGPTYDQRGVPFDRADNGKGTGAQIDIGAYEVQTGSIKGQKWNDLNGNGNWEQPAEPALAGWLIYLDANHNAALDNGETSTFTDAGGNYSFTDLAPAIIRLPKSRRLAGHKRTRENRSRRA